MFMLLFLSLSSRSRSLFRSITWHIHLSLYTLHEMTAPFPYRQKAPNPSAKKKCKKNVEVILAWSGYDDKCTMTTKHAALCQNAKPKPSANSPPLPVSPSTPSNATAKSPISAKVIRLSAWYRVYCMSLILFSTYLLFFLFLRSCKS